MYNLPGIKFTDSETIFLEALQSKIPELQVEMDKAWEEEIGNRKKSIPEYMPNPKLSDLVQSYLTNSNNVYSFPSQSTSRSLRSNALSQTF